MAQIDVTTAAVKVPVSNSQRPAIYNLGPGDIFIGRDAAVTIEDGFPVGPNGGYEFPGDAAGGIWLVSDSTADVRVMVVG